MPRERREKNSDRILCCQICSRNAIDCAGAAAVWERSSEINRHGSGML